MNVTQKAWEIRKLKSGLRQKKVMEISWSECMKEAYIYVIMKQEADKIAQVICDNFDDLGIDFGVKSLDTLSWRNAV